MDGDFPILAGSGGGGGGGSGGKGGGKKGAGSTPAEQKDSLISRAVARIVDLLSEGEIGGLVNGSESVFFGDTPLSDFEDSSGSTSVQFTERLGTPDQDPLPGIDAVEVEKSVGEEVKKRNLDETLTGGVIRQIVDPNLDAVRVRIFLPALSEAEDDGDIVGAEVAFTIEVRPNGGGWQLPNFGRSLAAFGSQTSDNAQGLVVRAEVLTPGLARTESWSIHIQYRAVGGPTWIDLGQDSGTITNDPIAILQQTNDAPIYTYKATTITRTFTVDGLTEAAYELQAVAGSIVKKSEIFAKDVIINGKTTSGFEQDYLVILPTDGAPWDIRVTRITEDSDTVKLQNRLIWQSYTEIIQEKLTYPDSALIGMIVDSKDFTGDLTQRSYLIHGYIPEVPSNYDPEDRTYTGIWDGTFQRAWTNNPAWGLRSLLKDPRFGLGLDDDQIDKWTLYQISKYCDEMVPDGFGGMEPRFTMNVFIQSRQEAYSVIQSWASVFRGITYFATGAVTIGQDAPRDPEVLVSPANIIGGRIQRSGTAIKDRPTVVQLIWNDPNDHYRQAIEVVEDVDAMRRFGFRPREVTAFGTTSRGQAHRLGKWILEVERSSSEIIEYQAGLDHAGVAPGQTIKVTDPDHAGIRMGGRIKSATANQVTLDNQVSLAGGETYTLTVALPATLLTLNGSHTLGDDTVTINAGSFAGPVRIGDSFVVKGNPQRYTVTAEIAESLGLFTDVPIIPPLVAGYNDATEVTLEHTIADGMVTDAPGDHTVLNLAEALPRIPLTNAVWILKATNVEPELFRVISNREIKQGSYAIKAVRYDPTIYERVDLGTAFDPPRTSTLDTGPLPPPTGLDFAEFLYFGTQKQMLVKGILSWAPPKDPRAQYYDVELRREGGDWQRAGQTGGVSFEILNLSSQETYDFRVRAGGASKSPYVLLESVFVQGKAAAPPDVPQLERQGRMLFWTYPNPPIDLQGYLIRVQPGVSYAWATASPIHTGVITSSPFQTDPLGNGVKSILIKAIDLDGNESVNATALITNLGDRTTENVIEALDFAAAGFPGTITDGAVASGTLFADDTGDIFWNADPQALFWGLVNDDFWQTSYLQMTYEADFVPPTPGPLIINHDIVGSPFTVEYRDDGGDIFWESDSNTFWPNDADIFWSGPGQYLSLSELDVTRQKYGLRVITGSGNLQGQISELRAEVDVPDLFEELLDVAVPSAGIRLPISKPFKVIKNVRMDLFDDDGDAIGVRIVDRDVTNGPLIKAFDANNLATSALINATVQGY